MLLDKLISDVRIEIADEEQVIWRPDEIIRAIEKSVSLMSRLIPKRSIVEETLIRTPITEPLTILSGVGRTNHKPLKIGSVSITGRVLDTDYSINHLTGTVTAIGGRLPDGTYSISYELDAFILDLSRFLPDYIKIERVEYPAGSIPPSLLTFDVFGDFLQIRGTIPLAHAKQLRVIYLGKWTPPTTTMSGDYPSHLNDIVIIGSAGQALIYKAEEYVNESITIAGSIVTLLNGLGSIVIPPDYTFVKPAAPTLPTAPVSPTAPTLVFTEAIAAMNAVATEITAAKADLTTGRGLINTGTRGEDVAANYGNYAAVGISAASRRMDEALGRLEQVQRELTRYSGQVTTYGSAVNAYANEVSGAIGRYREQTNTEIAGVGDFRSRLERYQAQVNTVIVRVVHLNSQVENYLNIAGRYLASGQAKINEMLSALGYKPEFTGQRALTEQRS